MIKTLVHTAGYLLTLFFWIVVMYGDWIYNLLKVQYLAAIAVTFLIYYFIYYPKGSLHGIIVSDKLKVNYMQYYRSSVFIEVYISISIFVYMVFSIESIDYFLFITSATLLFIYFILYIDYFLSTRYGNKKVHE